MLEIASITFKVNGKVRFKDIVIPSQKLFFDDFDALKRICTELLDCDDFVILKIEFRKVEVFQ